MLILNRQEAVEFVRSRADTFTAAANPSNPFATADWYTHFLRTVADDSWRIAIPGAPHRDDSFMLLRAPANSLQELCALTNYYASLYTPIVSSIVDRVAAARTLVADVDAHRPRVSSLQLSAMDFDSADAQIVENELRQLGWYTRRFFCFGNWYLPCDGLTFAEYMSGRDSRLRNTVNRKSKKFRSGSPTRLSLICGTQDLEPALHAYEVVYSRSWKRPEPYPDFVPGWARICARNGWLRLGIAYVDDQPAAAQFWFTIGRRAYIFKLAYDESFASASAGSVLTAMLVQHSLDVDRVVEIDYLTGDDEYKKSWMNHRRERYGLIACNPRTARGAGRAAWEFMGKLKERAGGARLRSPERLSGHRSTPG
jgi:hypothetical protein